jgi:hypothetical protein
MTAVDQNSLVLFGGCDALYNGLADLQWIRIDFQNERPVYQIKEIRLRKKAIIGHNWLTENMDFGGRWGHCACIVNHSVMFIFGGKDNDQDRNDLVRIDLGSLREEIDHAMAIPHIKNRKLSYITCESASSSSSTRYNRSRTLSDNSISSGREAVVTAEVISEGGMSIPKRRKPAFTCQGGVLAIFGGFDGSTYHSDMHFRLLEPADKLIMKASLPKSMKSTIQNSGQYYKRLHSLDQNLSFLDKICNPSLQTTCSLIVSCSGKILYLDMDHLSRESQTISMLISFDRDFSNKSSPPELSFPPSFVNFMQAVTSSETSLLSHLSTQELIDLLELADYLISPRVISLCEQLLFWRINKETSEAVKRVALKLGNMHLLASVNFFDLWQEQKSQPEVQQRPGSTQDANQASRWQDTKNSLLLSLLNSPILN